MYFIYLDEFPNKKYNDEFRDRGSCCFSGIYTWC